MPDGRNPIGLAVFLGGGLEYDWAGRWDMLSQGWAIIQSGTDAKPVDANWSGMLVVDDDHSVSAVAPEIARRVDDQIAEDVYAAEAFIAFARGRYPALQSASLVVVGLSRGAFSLPAFVARLDDRVDAAVICLVTIPRRVVESAEAIFPRFSAGIPCLFAAASRCSRRWWQERKRSQSASARGCNWIICCMSLIAMLSRFAASTSSNSV